MKATLFALCLLTLVSPAHAQQITGQSGHNHMPGHMMNHSGHSMPGHAAGMAHGAGSQDELVQGGQSAFAAIQEIVTRMMADPATDWSKANIEALRQHLIDMDNVTLRAQVSTEEIEGGARFVATSADKAVIASIRAMVPAHAATMDGVEGWRMVAQEVPGGAAMTVTGSDVERIRALGFIGIMTVGMHHQAHHLAIATGNNPHQH